MLVIREAEAADAPLIVEMIRELAEFERELDQLTPLPRTSCATASARTHSFTPLSRSGTVNRQRTRSTSLTIQPGQGPPVFSLRICSCEPSSAVRASARRCCGAWPSSRVSRTVTACAGKCSTGTRPQLTFMARWAQEYKTSGSPSCSWEALSSSLPQKKGPVDLWSGNYEAVELTDARTHGFPEPNLSAFSTRQRRVIVS